MFNKEKLTEALKTYKENFTPKHWEEEKFKWEAVKCFQDNWDINAPDFADMLERSLKKTYGLLMSANNFPAKMMHTFAKAAPEDVRAMYMSLFDESKDVSSRIIEFKEQSSVILEKTGHSGYQHYQYENAISTYLWLRYPDKYYIYKYSEIKAVAEELDSKLVFKKGAYVDNLNNFYTLYDEMCEEIKKDKELVELIDSYMTDEQYADVECKTLTIDVGFFISRVYKKQKIVANINNEYWPSLDYYNPNLSKEDWKQYILEVEMPEHPSPRAMLKGIMELGGEATSKKLAETYGGHPTRYVGCAVNLGKRVKKHFNLSPCMDGEKESYFVIPFLGKYVLEDGGQYYSYKIRPEILEALNEIDLTSVSPYAQIEDEDTIVEQENYEKYSKEDFLNEVYMTEDRYNTLTSVLKNKKNIILQGAPGVGKTFAAKRLAYSMMGEKDDSRIEFIQFHQNYSYEDFMMGYKPVEDGFELKYGIFYTFCQKAANNPEKDYFFIIDEINRGNMSKIFGELLMLIERDYRGTKATLAYNGLSFAVPKNLYIIGMMNTADRSLAMIDYALRRRFSFFDMEPGFDSEGFRKYQNELNNENFTEIISKIEELNRAIRLDKSLGKGFCIGHSYFCGQTECTDEWLKSVVEYDILPMLSEYWFDDATKLQQWENILRGVLHD